MRLIDSGVSCALDALSDSLVDGTPHYATPRRTTPRHATLHHDMRCHCQRRCRCHCHRYCRTQSYHTSLCMSARMHACTHARMHACTHIHTHTGVCSFERMDSLTTRVSPTPQLPRERFGLECLRKLFALCERRTPEQDPFSVSRTAAPTHTQVHTRTHAHTHKRTHARMHARAHMHAGVHQRCVRGNAHAVAGPDPMWTCPGLTCAILGRM